MSPVSEAKMFSKKKNDILINSGHKTAAAIEEFHESDDDGVFSPFFLS